MKKTITLIAVLAVSTPVMAQVSYPFFDGFESGNYSNWTVGTGSYTREVTSATAAIGTYSFTQTGGSNLHRNGVSASFSTAQQPTTVSFSVRTANANSATGYFVLGNGTTDVIFFYMDPAGYLYANADGDSIVPYSANIWYNIRFELNWSTHTFDYYVNSTLAASAIPFRSTLPINIVYLYNFYSGQAWWDNIAVGMPVDTVNIPHISVSPGNFRVGPTYPTVQTLQICNTGIRDTLQYTIDTVAAGRIVADTASGQLAAGACRNVQLTFNRSGLLPGNNIIPLLVHHNAVLDINPVSIPCTLFVDSAEIPHITLSPGGFRVGPAYPAIQTLQICNPGTQDTLQYSIDSVAGRRVVADTVSGRLGAGDCRNVSLTFNRSGLPVGNTIVQLVVRHNSPLSPNPISVPCTLYVDSASVPHIALTPASYRVGPTYPAVETLQICNTGAQDTLQYSLNFGSGGIIINEVCNSVDYIELLNTGAIDVNIGGWRLVWTDNAGSAFYSYTIPAGITVRSHRCVQFRETGTSNDSVIYMNGGNIGWVTASQLSVSLLNSSGVGVDFFKTSGDAALPPAGTSWSGTGATAGYGNYYRSSTNDNNSAADWVGSSSYTPCLPNPGQTFSGGGGGGLVSADTASGRVAAGGCRNVQLTFNRTGLLPGPNVFQFTVSHNSPLSTNPLSVQCTLFVDSASVPHIALTPTSFRIDSTDTMGTLQICNTSTQDTLQYSIDTVAGRRVIADTTTGRLAAGACRNVQLTFNRSGLPLGNTIVQLVVRHNSPLSPNPISVPCTLYVDSASVPHIALTPASFRIEPTDTNVQTLQICNSSTRDTLQYSIDSVAGRRIVADTTSGLLAAGSCRNVQLTFNRSGLMPGNTIVQLVVRHNGPLEPNPISVPCTLVVDSTTMTCSTLSMAVTIYTGDTAMRYVTLQNTGSSILVDTLITVPRSAILINEVYSGADGVELINTGNTDVNIGGYRMLWTDNASSSGSYTVPAGTVIDAQSCMVLMEGTGTGSDSVIYMGNILGWVQATELSVSLLNSSGTGVDFFKTSGNASSPPSGTTWTGSGVTAGYDAYHRSSTTDNNTSADWTGASSSTDYTYCLPNPGQILYTRHISAAQDSFYIAPGQSTVLRFKYDASALITGGFYIDTFLIIQNSINVASPINVICSLTVISNIIELIPVSPDPTVNRQPGLAWHPVASASLYTVEASLTPSFSALEITQQTADTVFTPLADLPLGTIYWRVRSDLGVRYSLPDAFFIQNDSIPLLIPMVPDTIGSQPSTLFTWHPSTGATSYRITVFDIDSTVPQTVLLSTVTDTFYRYGLNLPAAKYAWTVSANFDYNRTAYPDTFWVDATPVLPGGSRKLLPTAYDLTVRTAAGHLKITCAIPRQASAARGAAVAIDLFDIRGKLVRVLFNGMLAAGYPQLSVRVGNVAAGVYYCRMRAGSQQKIAAVHLMR